MPQFTSAIADLSAKNDTQFDAKQFLVDHNIPNDPVGQFIQNDECYKNQKAISEYFKAYALGGLDVRAYFGRKILQKVNLPWNYFEQAHNDKFSGGGFLSGLAPDDTLVTCVANANIDRAPILGSGIDYSGLNGDGIINSADTVRKIAGAEFEFETETRTEVQTSEMFQQAYKDVSTFKIEGSVEYTIKSISGNINADSQKQIENSITITKNSSSKFEISKKTLRKFSIGPVSLSRNEGIRGFAGMMHVVKSFDFFKIVTFDGQIHPDLIDGFGGFWRLSDKLNADERRVLVSGSVITTSEVFVEATSTFSVP